MRHARTAPLVAALLIAGCGGAPSPDRVELRTAALSCYAGGEHPVVAQLVADAQVGTTFTGLPVVWPPGFTGRRAGSEVEVLDATGTVRAKTGHRYWIAQALLGSDPGVTDAYPAAIDCGYPWDFGECDPSGEPTEFCEPEEP